MNSFKSINCRGHLLDLTTPKVMAIVNLTPDSFLDGGKFRNENDILNYVYQLLHDGADIIDLGAMSTRPGSQPISTTEEIRKLLPVVEVLVRKFPEAIFSVDTYRSAVAHQALHAGAHIINDISGGTMDENMFATVAEFNAPYILSHIQGTPETMQKNPLYENVTQEILEFFISKLAKLRQLNVTDVIVDPGIGFGKTVEHNFELISSLRNFEIVDCPIMVGVSRKGLINKILGTSPQTALNGTTVVNTLALLNGANVLRVHDVKEAIEAIKLVSVYQKMADKNG